MKTCSHCGQVKQVSEFYRRQASNDGLQKHCKACSNDRVARKRALNREYMRSYMRSEAGRAACRRHLLKKKYGLTPEQFDALLALQEHRCACCRRTDPGGKSNQWHVDHCHVTGAVRGLLCHSCNVGLGCFGDDLPGIKNALNYLERHYNDAS